MWHVYRGTNHTQREIYYGVSKDPDARVDGSHCRGYTKAISHWDCENDDIDWEVIATADNQSAASTYAHKQERGRVPQGYGIIQTAGV